mgnify:CR=1 FL=1
MQLRKIAEILERWLSPLIATVNSIGASVIVVLMLVTVTNVVGRRFFNHPIPGNVECSEFMLAIMTSFFIAQCELLRGHVTVGVVVSRLRQRAQDIIDSIMYLFFLVVSCLLTWRLFVYALQELHGHISVVLKVPDYPFLFIATLGFALLSLVVLVHFLLFLAGALKK